MWKLHRYYLKQVAASSAITLSVLFGIVFVSLVYRGINQAQGFGLLAAAEITLLWATDALPHLLPISLLFGTVLVFARASQDREITAISSAGISPRVAMTSALLIGILFSLGASVALHNLVPRAHYAKYRVVAEGMRAVLLQTGMLTDRISFRGLVMVWRERDSLGHWRDVTIRVRRAREEFGPLGGMDVVLADEAWVEVDDYENIVLVLKGARSADGRAVLPEYTRFSVPMRTISQDKLRRENDRDLTSEQILSEVERGVHRNPVGARFLVNRRSCFALIPTLLAPIGFCIGVLSRQRGRVLALVFAMVPLFLMYFSDILAGNLVRSFDWPVLGWLPAMVLTVLGLPFCYRLLRF